MWRLTPSVLVKDMCLEGLFLQTISGSAKTCSMRWIPKSGVSCPRVANCERPRRQDLGRPRQAQKVERVLNECGMDTGESIHHYLMFCMKMMVMIAKVCNFFCRE